MFKRQMIAVMSLCTLLALGVLMSGCASTGGAQNTATSEEIAANIVYEVADSAQLTKVAYFFKDYKGASRLHMEVGVKNISPETKRYRVNIFLPEGPSGGGMYPRKIKGDVKGIEPGKELSRVFPMYFSELPSGYMIVVKELN